MREITFILFLLSVASCGSIISITEFKNSFKFLQISSDSAIESSEVILSCGNNLEINIDLNDFIHSENQGSHYYRMRIKNDDKLYNQRNCKCSYDSFIGIQVKFVKFNGEYIPQDNQNIKKLVLNKDIESFYNVKLLSKDEITGGAMKSKQQSLTPSKKEQIKLEKNSKLKLNEELRKYNLENLNGRKVFLSLSTNPSRIFKIHIILKSLNLDLVDTIFLNLPKKYRNIDNYEIPIDLFEQFPKLKVLQTNVDLGSTTKIIPAVYYVKKLYGDFYKDDIFISVDDDYIYTDNVIDSVVYNVLFTGSVACYTDWGVCKPEIYGDNLSPKGSHYNLEGFTGVGYYGKHFNIEEIIRFQQFALLNNDKWCMQSDDFILSYFVRRNGASIKKMISADTKRFYDIIDLLPMDSWKDKYSLHKTPYIDSSNQIKKLGHRYKYNTCFSLALNFLGF